MCGFSGIVRCGGQVSDAQLFEAVTRMNDSLYHRGPDDADFWIAKQDNVALGHRRLAIIDLSDGGKQPMHSACGRYVLVYNGELYNFKSIGTELKRAGISFYEESDTSVLLAAIVHFGLAAAIEKSHGMFAFALWDRKEKTLSLVRDRLGEKPLYYGYSGKNFLFASELKALSSHPEWIGELDRGALTLQLRHGYIPGPYSIYRGIYKLAPGSILTLHIDRIRKRAAIQPSPRSSAGDELSPVRYWSARRVAESSVSDPMVCPLKEACDQLDYLLRTTVRNQMISDVPLGAFLSGGVDSSLVVALMQTQSSHPIKTFTIGFHEERYNEATYAKRVADHLGTRHTELYLTSSEAMEVIPDIAGYYDEPFSDPSQIPTFLVAKLAREQVTVALSGDGGDELFAGYDRYFWAESIWRSMQRAPLLARTILANSLQVVPKQAWDKVVSVLPSRYQVNQPGEKLHKLGDLLRQTEFISMYRRLISHWAQPQQVVIGSSEPSTVMTDDSLRPNFQDPILTMQYLDTVSYLPDDILVKVDRATMSVSLESRIPLLDHNVFDFAWRLPRSTLIGNNSGKGILKQLLYRYIPHQLVDRPKMGFGVPIGDWLRGGMLEWAEEQLDPYRLRRDGIFNTDLVRSKWLEHKNGRRNWEYELWNILMFQAWNQNRNLERNQFDVTLPQKGVSPTTTHTGSLSG